MRAGNRLSEQTACFQHPAAIDFGSNPPDTILQTYASAAYSICALGVPLREGVEGWFTTTAANVSLALLLCSMTPKTL